MAYLRALAKQDIVPLPIAIRAVLDRVIAGEYAIGLEMNNTHAAISAAQGAPVKWVPLNPVSETLQVAGITKGAPHPNAARLFIDFMIVARRTGDLPRQRLRADAPRRAGQDPGAQAAAGRLQSRRLHAGQPRNRDRRAGRRSTRTCSAERRSRASPTIAWHPEASAWLAGLLSLLAASIAVTAAARPRWRRRALSARCQRSSRRRARKARSSGTRR